MRLLKCNAVNSKLKQKKVLKKEYVFFAIGMLQTLALEQGSKRELGTEGAESGSWYYL